MNCKDRDNETNGEKGKCSDDKPVVGVRERKRKKDVSEDSTEEEVERYATPTMLLNYKALVIWHVPVSDTKYFLKTILTRS